MGDKSAIVILNWNCADTIIACVESAARTTSQKNIIFVDNNSHDNSVQLVRDSFPEVVMILNDKNRGFSGGVNPGIRHAIEHEYQYVALLNPDATVEQQWLEKLEEALDTHKEVGIAASKLIDPRNNTIDTAGDAISDWLLPYITGAGDPASDFSDARYIPSGCAGSSLYRVAMFKDVGLFDETYFIYYEDSDFSVRAQHKGWRSYYVPSSIGYHTRSTSGKKVPGVVVEQSFRNRYLFVVKNIPLQLLLRHGYKFLLSAPLFFINDSRRGHPISALKSVWGCIAVTPKALQLRREVMKTRVISNSVFAERVLVKGPPPKIRVLKALSKVFK